MRSPVPACRMRPNFLPGATPNFVHKTMHNGWQERHAPNLRCGDVMQTVLSRMAAGGSVSSCTNAMRLTALQKVVTARLGQSGPGLEGAEEASAPDR